MRKEEIIQIIEKNQLNIISTIFLLIYSISAKNFLFDFMLIILIKVFFDTVSEAYYSTKKKYFKHLIGYVGVWIYITLLMLDAYNLTTYTSSTNFFSYVAGFFKNPYIYLIITPLIVNDYKEFKNKEASVKTAQNYFRKVLAITIGLVPAMVLLTFVRSFGEEYTVYFSALVIIVKLMIDLIPGEMRKTQV